MRWMCHGVACEMGSAQCCHVALSLYCKHIELATSSQTECLQHTESLQVMVNASQINEELETLQKQKGNVAIVVEPQAPVHHPRLRAATAWTGHGCTALVTRDHLPCQRERFDLRQH